MERMVPSEEAPEPFSRQWGLQEGTIHLQR